MEEVINIQIINMDVMIPEQVSRNADGSYTIFLNARLTHEHRLESYQHALQHIKAGDFDEEYGDVQNIEAVTHALQSAEDTPAAVKVNDERIQKRLEAIRRQRKKIQKQLNELENDMKFLDFSSREAFDRAEQQWLYGKDL